MLLQESSVDANEQCTLVIGKIFHIFPSSHEDFIDMQCNIYDQHNRLSGIGEKQGFNGFLSLFMKILKSQPFSTSIWNLDVFFHFG